MKKITFSLSLFTIILSMILLFDFNKNTIQFTVNKINYSLNIDGKITSSIPTEGIYYLESYTCENGSELTWDQKNNNIYIKGTSLENESCSVNLISKPFLNTMKIGDYVAYEGNNGCLKGELGTTGTSNAEAGNSCLGENSNQSVDTSNYTYGYCYSENYKYFVYGWRIAYIEERKVHLISAGSPECIKRTSSDENATQIASLNLAALDYCSTIYADGGSCPTDNSNTWAMGNYDFSKITEYISGTASNLTTDYGNNDCIGLYALQRCGYYNDLLDNGGYYYFSAYYNTDSVTAAGVAYNGASHFVNYSTGTSAYGLRPIIKLSSDVYVTGGSGTMEDPYTIGI